MNNILKSSIITRNKCIYNIEKCILKGPFEPCRTLNLYLNKNIQVLHLLC